MLKRFAIILIFTTLIFTAACDNFKDADKATTSKTKQSLSTAENFGQGGRENVEYDYLYTHEFTMIDAVLIQIARNIDSEKLKNWINEFEEDKRDHSECNKLYLVQDFSISKETLLKEIKNTLEKSNTIIPTTRQQLYLLSDEQIDIMYSGDMKLINETFVNKAAVLYDNEIYTAKWIAENSIEKIMEVGIPLETLKAKQEIWANDKTIMIDANNRRKLNEKVLDFEKAYKEN